MWLQEALENILTSNPPRSEVKENLQQTKARGALIRNKLKVQKGGQKNLELQSTNTRSTSSRSSLLFGVGRPSIQNQINLRHRGSTRRWNRSFATQNLSVLQNPGQFWTEKRVRFYGGIRCTRSDRSLLLQRLLPSTQLSSSARSWTLILRPSGAM